MKRLISTRSFRLTRIAVVVAAGVAGAMLIGSGSVRAPARASADGAPGGSLPITVHPDQLGSQLRPGPTTVTLHLGGDFRSGRLTALATSSPADLSATTGITLGGQQVGPHGAFLPPRSTPVSVDGQTATAAVPAGSSAIIQFG